MRLPPTALHGEGRGMTGHGVASVGEETWWLVAMWWRGCIEKEQNNGSGWKTRNGEGWNSVTASRDGDRDGAAYGREKGGGMTVRTWPGRGRRWLCSILMAMMMGFTVGKEAFVMVAEEARLKEARFKKSGVNGVDHDYQPSEEDFEGWNAYDSDDSVESVADREEMNENHKIVDGLELLCPTVKLSKEEKKGVRIPWRRALIVKLIGKRVGFCFMQGRLMKLWNPQRRMEVIDLDNDYSVIHFADWGKENTADKVVAVNHSEQNMESGPVEGGLGPTGCFGPWMMVQRKNRRQNPSIMETNKVLDLNSERKSEPIQIGSRFVALVEDSNQDLVAEADCSAELNVNANDCNPNLIVGHRKRKFHKKDIPTPNLDMDGDMIFENNEQGVFIGNDAGDINGKRESLRKIKVSARGSQVDQKHISLPDSVPTGPPTRASYPKDSGPVNIIDPQHTNVLMDVGPLVDIGGVGHMEVDGQLHPPGPTSNEQYFVLAQVARPPDVEILEPNLVVDAYGVFNYRVETSGYSGAPGSSHVFMPVRESSKGAYYGVNCVLFLIMLMGNGLFAEASIVHLPSLKSDHKPILLRLHGGGYSVRSNRPFRFLAPWLADASFKNVVEEAWQVEGNWNYKVRNFQDKVLKWNSNHYGNIFHRKRRILARMKGINNRNKIEALSKENSDLDTDKREIQSLIVDPFKKLFEEEGSLANCPLTWSQRGWHPVSWDNIRKPILQGGLGFRSLHNFNKALLMKVGWGLLHDPNAYWVQVVRSKYGCGNDIIPRVRKKGNESLLWRGVRRTWNHVQEGMFWVVHDSRNVRFWVDCWLPSRVILKELCLVPSQDVWVTSMVSDFADPVSGWNVLLLRTVLPEEAVLEILGEVASPDPLWKVIWRWDGPERVRCFMWLVVNNGLKTRSKGFRCGLFDSESFPICHQSVETILHVLRDCVTTKTVWRGLGADGFSAEFFNNNVHEWLLFNLTGPLGGEWCIIFGPAIWNLWRSRNEVVFDNFAVGTNGLIGREGWIKFNVDGSVKLDSKKAGCGGVMRDHNGNWLGGFSCNIGFSGVFMAELRGIISALHIAWERRFLKVWIESDSLTAMKLINKGDFHNHPYAYALNQIAY
ncbi:Ribonuclease H-like superfamily [Sesbania bispinosa]|nr:Ribonuclease H-like superfamily [Sesbania bispinosa]